MRTICRDIVGAFIISSDDRILLEKVGVYKDHWAVPGGGIEQEESVEEALKREILEETGLDISSGTIEKLSGVPVGESDKILRDTGEKVFVKMNFHDFLVELKQTSYEIELKSDDDFTDGTWFSAEELKEIKLSPPSKARLKELGYLN